MGALWNRLTAAIITGLLVLIALGGWLTTQARDDVRAAAHAQSALAAANALAALIDADLLAAAPDASLQATVSAFADSLSAEGTHGAASRLVDIERRVVITPGAARALTREEKPLYDRGVQLRSNALTNAEEARAARPVREVAATASSGSALSPITRSGAVIGYAEVTLTPAPPPPPTWLGHAVLLLSVAGALALGVLLWRPSRAAWQTGLLSLLVVAALASLLWARGPASIARSEDRAVAQSAELVASASRLAGVQTAFTDRFGAPTALLTTTGTVPAELGRSLIATGLLALALTAFVGFGAAGAMGRAFSQHRTAYLFLVPALIGMVLLSIFPFLYGVGLSFTDTTLFNQDKNFAERFVGLANYQDVLIDFDLYEGEAGSRVLDYTNFYWTLFMTVVWTISNVAIGVGLGLALAMLLNIKGLRGVGIYRTLLILPWALPNYITALTWKGIFHPQFGAANEVIQAFGGDPVRWFDSVWPSFFTGLATNGWLSFPFMMVVCLGALQAVDEDMYEAARLDGAGPWSRFRHITWPSLQSTLMPAVVVSVVWTFNMFNVIYLVSAGQPGGATEILVTRAYKLAFEDYRYGYAAAYSVVIFALLLVYGWMQVQQGLKQEAKR
jgi:arabinogalactan oligomer/maltooligosaccharide transport system permease protein